MILILTTRSNKPWCRTHESEEFKTKLKNLLSEYDITLIDYNFKKGNKLRKQPKKPKGWNYTTDISNLFKG